MNDHAPAVELDAGPSPSPAAWGIWHVAAGLSALLLTTILVTSLAAWFTLPVCSAEGASPGDCRDLLPGLQISLATITIASTAALNVVQIGLVYALAFQGGPPVPRSLGLCPPRTSLPITAGAIFLALVASLAFAHAFGLAASALEWDLLVPPELDQNLILPGAWAALTVFGLAIWTPFAEELFFRGFVLRGLSNRWGAGAGLIVSSAIFAGMHFLPAIVIPVFVTGLLLGALYLYTRSLWPSVIVHALQNGLALLLTGINP
jgi:membrane protease YdiL (CAAX protease family)